MQDVVIVAWTAGNRVAKFQDYPTVAECQQHLDRVTGRWPEAFIAVAPSDNVTDWLVDPVAKTVSSSPPPPPPKPQPAEAAILMHALKTKVALTDAEMAAAKADLMK